MSLSYPAGGGTVAAIRHPLHLIPVALPAGLFAGSFAAAIAFIATADAFWLRGALWLLTAGIVTGFGGEFSEYRHAGNP